MISPFKSLNIKSGANASEVNDRSIWNSQFKLRLLNLTVKLENAIQQNDRRSVEYFMGLINRCKYHPDFSWTTLVPIDMLLLSKTPRYLRKGHKNDRKKSQHSPRPSRDYGRYTANQTVPAVPTTGNSIIYSTTGELIKSTTGTKKKSKCSRSK